MLSLSPIKAKINWRQILWLSIAFFALRLASFLLRDSSLLQALFVLLNISVLAALFFKNKPLAWYYLLLEFVLGGAGLFFQAFSLSLRTILILEFLLLYFTSIPAFAGITRGNKTATANELAKFPRLRELIREHKNILLVFLIAILFLGLAFYLGLKNQHNLFFILQDLLPFSFFLLVFPAREFLKDKNSDKNLLNLLFIFILGSSLWSVFNLILFQQGIAILHSPYYNWLRDFAAAKITYLDAGFWRIVFPEQILLVASILFLSWLYLKTKDKIYLLFLVFANIILALIICFLFLKYQNKIKDWFLLGAFILISFLAVFFIINLSISSAKNLGLNILGLRLPGIENIKVDESANARLELLSEITKQIKNSPLIGQGLGLNISFINKANLQVNTRHFDWGYLEILAKFGVLGFLFYYYFWLKLAKNLFINKKQSINFVLLASLVSILLANIWAQTTLHILGVIFFVFILAFSQNQRAKSC